MTTYLKTLNSVRKSSFSCSSFPSFQESFFFSKLPHSPQVSSFLFRAPFSPDLLLWPFSDYTVRTHAFFSREYRTIQNDESQLISRLHEPRDRRQVPRNLQRHLFLLGHHWRLLHDDLAIILPGSQQQRHSSQVEWVIWKYWLSKQFRQLSLLFSHHSRRIPWRHSGCSLLSCVDQTLPWHHWG